jgi:hypothetical protein
MGAIGFLSIPCCLPARFLASIQAPNDQESLPSSLTSSFSLSIPKA